MVKGQKRIGTYVHRDGRKVDMRTGMQRVVIDEKETWRKVFFYMFRGHEKVISRDELFNDWNHILGNHIFGTQAGFQRDILGYTGYHQDCSLEAWKNNPGKTVLKESKKKQ